jgi:hypothetical protein
VLARWQAALWAAVLRAGPGAVLSHGTAEAEDHPGEDGESGEEPDRCDAAGAGQGDSGQRGDGYQPVKQPGALHPEAFNGPVPGDEHQRGDRDREIGQRGQLGRGGEAQDGWSAGGTGYDGGGQQQQAGQAAGVDGDGEGAEPGQQGRGQQGCTHDATERPGRP